MTPNHMESTVYDMPPTTLPVNTMFHKSVYWSLDSKHDKTETMVTAFYYDNWCDQNIIYSNSKSLLYETSKLTYTKLHYTK